MIALSNPPDLFLRLMSDLKDFYCENDFLLDSKAVLLLSHKYQELNRGVTILDGYGDQYQEKTVCEYNGYKTLAAVSHCLISAASERGQEIWRGDRNGNVKNRRGDRKFEEVAGMEMLRIGEGTGNLER